MFQPRGLDYESGGQEFESLRARQIAIKLRTLRIPVEDR
jgi:hypothetical protein